MPLPVVVASDDCALHSVSVPVHHSPASDGLALPSSHTGRGDTEVDGSRDGEFLIGEKLSAPWEAEQPGRAELVPLPPGQGWPKSGFFFKKTQPGGFFWVLLGFIGFYWVFLGFLILTRVFQEF